MMRRVAMFVAAVAMASGAAAMPVSTFLAKAEALQKKGPLALMSSDLKLLTNQVKADAAQLRAENNAAAAAGRARAYCTPEAGVRMSSRDVVDAMRAVPAAQRQGTTTKAALRAYFARRFPCPA